MKKYFKRLFKRGGVQRGELSANAIVLTALAIIIVMVLVPALNIAIAGGDWTAAGATQYLNRAGYTVTSPSGTVYVDTVLPNADSTYDIGASGNEFDDVYCDDLYLDGSEIDLSSPAQGEIIYYNGSSWVALGTGTSGYVLAAQGAGADPVWSATAAPTAFTGLTDTPGNYAGSAGLFLRVNTTPDGVEFTNAGREIMIAADNSLDRFKAMALASGGTICDATADQTDAINAATALISSVSGENFTASTYSAYDTCEALGNWGGIIGDETVTCDAAVFHEGSHSIKCVEGGTNLWGAKKTALGNLDWSGYNCAEVWIRTDIAMALYFYVYDSSGTAWEIFPCYTTADDTFQKVRFDLGTPWGVNGDLDWTDVDEIRFLTMTHSPGKHFYLDWITHNNWVSLDNGTFQPGSVTVGAHVEGTDYDLDYSDGRIISIVGGGIGSGSAQTIDYGYGSGAVVFAPGDYYFSAPCTKAITDINWTSPGGATIITDDCTGFTQAGDGQRWTNLTITCDLSDQTQQSYGIDTAGYDEYRIDNCTIKDFAYRYSAAVRSYNGSDRGSILRSTIRDNFYGIIFDHPSTGGWQNLVYGVDFFDQHSVDVFMDENENLTGVFNNTSDHAGYGFLDIGESATCTGIHSGGNIIHRTWDGSSIRYTNADYCTSVGDKVYDSYREGFLLVAGTGNSIIDFWAQDCDLAGLTVSGSASHTSIKNPTIINCCDELGQPLYISTSGDYVDVDGVNVRDTRGTRMTYSLIGVNGTDHVSVTNFKGYGIATDVSRAGIRFTNSDYGIIDGFDIDAGAGGRDPVLITNSDHMTISDGRMKNAVNWAMEIAGTSTDIHIHGLNWESCNNDVSVAGTCSDIRFTDNIDHNGDPFLADNSGVTLSVWVADDSQNVSIATVPFAYVNDEAFVKVEVFVEEAFDSDGADELTVGYDADPDSVVTAIDVSSTGRKTVTYGVEGGWMGTSRALEVYYVNGGSEPTNGKVIVIITITAVEEEPS